jgi:hypothetical protein
MLKGLGAVSLSLPFLEAMYAPAYGAGAKTAIPTRLGWFYFGTGMNVRQFFPEDFGKDFTCSRILKPLEAYRDNMTVFTGTYLKNGGGHEGDYTFLTAAVGKTQKGITNSISVDQLAARQIGADTRFGSLQLSVARGTGYGGAMRTLSWNDRGSPLAAENDPWRMFNALFRQDSATGKKTREYQFQRKGSVLDYVAAEAKRLDRKISGADQEKLDEYLDSVRQVEVQLQRNIDWHDRPKPSINLNGMSSYDATYTDDIKDFSYATYSKMMYDLIALAYQTDSTRVITYTVRLEGPGGVYPEFDVSTDYHSLSHHGNVAQRLEELAKVDTIYMEHWAHLLQRLDASKMPDGSTLLDHTLLGLSSGMGIGHSKDKLPTAMFGGKATGVAHQGHLELEENTPLSRVWHTMIDRAGVKTGGTFQDSSGPIQELIG